MIDKDFFAPWRSLAEFTIDEAAALCAGVVPGSIPPPARRTSEQQKEFAAYNGWLRQIQEAHVELKIAMNYAYSRYYRREVPQFGEVQRARLVEWLESRGAVPAFFATQDAKNKADDVGMTTRERDTLLGLIGVLCEAAGISLMDETTKGHQEAAKILPWASDRRVTTSKETIAKKIVEARAAIRPKGAVQRTG